MKAIVLRKTKFSETDLIVQFLTEENQLVSAFAAGAQKSKRRFPHQFEWSGLYEIEIPSKNVSGLHRLRSCDLISYDSELTKSWDAFQRWATICEWISYDAHQVWSFVDIFELMRRLPRKGGAEAYLKFFLNEVETHGLAPQLGTCATCRRALLEDEAAWFHLETAEVHHLDCWSLDLQHVRRLTSEMRTHWQNPSLGVQGEDLDNWDQILVPFLEWHLQRSLKTQRNRTSSSFPRLFERREMNEPRL